MGEGEGAGEKSGSIAVRENFLKSSLNLNPSQLCWWAVAVY